MEYNIPDFIVNLQEGLKNSDMWGVVNIHELAFIKDYLPDGTPCWRLPTQEEINKFDEEKETKYGI